MEAFEAEHVSDLRAARYQVFNRIPAERIKEGVQRVVEGGVQAAVIDQETFALASIQAVCHAKTAFCGLDDVEEGDLIGRSTQTEPAITATYCLHQTSFA